MMQFMFFVGGFGGLIHGILVESDKNIILGAACLAVHSIVEQLKRIADAKEDS